MIVDEAREVLELIKTRIAQQPPKDTRPSVEEVEASAIALDIELSHLEQIKTQARKAFLQSLNESQMDLWKQYQAIVKQNFDVVRDDPLRDDEGQKSKKKAFVETLSPQQKELFAERNRAYRAWNKADEQQTRLYIRKRYFGSTPDIELPIAEVLFPENIPQNRRDAIQELLSHCPDKKYERMADTGISSFNFPLIHSNDQIIGFRILKIGNSNHNISDYLEDLSRMLDRTKADLSSLEGWKRVKTNKGVGYQYTATSPYNDLKFNVTNSLAVSDPNLDKFRTLHNLINGRRYTPDQMVDENRKLRDKGEKPLQSARVITLAGDAAEAILRKEYGLDLLKIPEASQYRE